MNIAEILPIAFDFLNANCNYAVLRNFRDLPYNVSRDIDIIIDKNDYNKKVNNFISLFDNHGYRLIQYYNGSEMHSMVFALVKNKRIELISFDFLFSIYVRDLILISGKEVLESKIFNGKIFHVSIEMEYLSKYLYNKLLHESYPLKYSEIQEEAFKTKKEVIERYLESLFGRNYEQNQTSFCSVYIKQWRKHFMRQFLSFGRYLFFTLKNILRPRGVSIGLTGPDGVGKTTVINEIIDNLNTIYRHIPLYHFRPTLFGNLGKVAHRLGLKKEVDSQCSKPHRGVKTGMLNSLLRLSYYSMDYVVGYFTKIYKSLFRRGIVIFDRYYTDIICDSRRSRIFLHKEFLYWWGRLFIPKLNYNILLTANAETILQRKQELNAEGIKSINEKIDYLSAKKGYIKILNENTPDDAVTEILSYIFEEQHKKNLKSFRQ